MNIRHECPMPDLSFKVTAPLFLHASDGAIHTIDRWSLSGFTIENLDSELPEDLQLSIPFQGMDISFPIEVQKSENEDIYEFKNLTVRQREILSVFYKGILAGRMVSSEELIYSMDTPVDLVPMGETEREMAAGIAKATPRLLRIIWNVVFYILLAAFLFGFVGNQIWKRLSFIELDHGRFVAPFVEYKASESAYVQRILVKEGGAVAIGDILMRLDDSDRKGQVEEVRTEIRIAERRLKQAQMQLDNHIGRRGEFRKTYWDAFYRHWYPWKKADPLYYRYPEFIQKHWDALIRFDKGLELQPGGYQDMLQEFERRADEYYLDLRRWKRDLSNKKAAADELHVIARTDGVVSAIVAIQGSFANKSDILIEVEENIPRWAVGWLDDDMVDSIHIGMPAKISYSFRGQAKSMAGKIVDVQAGTDDVQPDKFGMVVTIKADNAGLKKTRKWFRHNAPVRLQLKRNIFDIFIVRWTDEGT